MRKHPLSLGIAMLAASCASSLAWVGQAAHDWSVVVPVAETRFGVVEWQTGSSTVYLGIFDFALPCGAVSIAIILGLLAVAVFGASAVFFSNRRTGHDRAV